MEQWDELIDSAARMGQQEANSRVEIPDAEQAPPNQTLDQISREAEMIALKPVVVFVLLVFSSTVCAQTNRTQPRQTQPRQTRTPQSRTAGQAGQRTQQRTAPPNRQATRIQQAAPVGTAQPKIPTDRNGKPLFPLSEKEQARVDNILRFWEANTAKIKTFQCQFRQWDYDAIFGVKHKGKLLPKSESYGVLRYARPDKGLFHVTEVRDLVPPKAAKDKPTFKKRENDFGEKWVCDGNRVYEFDYRRKQLVETVLPPDMRGQGITNGPLPFMFGAKASELNQRYWIRELKPSEGIEQIWLDAYPKRREDAANFSRVIFFLDHKEFLPAALRMYDPNGKSYKSYTFTKRKKNDAIAGFLRVFSQHIPKGTPKGWQRVQRNLGGTDAPQQTARSRASSQQQSQRGVRTASGPRKTSPR